MRSIYHYKRSSELSLIGMMVRAAIEIDNPNVKQVSFISNGISIINFL